MARIKNEYKCQFFKLLNKPDTIGKINNKSVLILKKILANTSMVTKLKENWW